MKSNTESLSIENIELSARHHIDQLCLMQIGRIADEMRELIAVLSESVDLVTEDVSMAMTDADRDKLTDNGKTGIVVILPTGSMFEYPIGSLLDKEPPIDEVIERLENTGLLFSYSEGDVLKIDGRRYLDGAIQIFKTDPEGEVLPMTEEEIILARIEGTKMIRKVLQDGEPTYLFTLEKEEA